MKTDFSNAFSSHLDFAIAYAKRGWPVLPVHSIRNGYCSCGKRECPCPGKHPLTLHGLKDATTDEVTIQGWWRKWPFANVGILTGGKSGLFVLDVDPRNGGDETLKELEAKYGRLPDTVESLTGGGGRQIFFKHPGRYIKSRSNAFGPGLDIKADNAYVVVPPSIHKSGKRYEWEVSSYPSDIASAEIPAWLLKCLQKAEKKRSITQDEPIPEGKRNSTLSSMAGSMRRRGMSENAIRTALLEENCLRCDPPLPENEVSQIANSISKYPPEQTAEKAGSSKKENQATKLVKLAKDAEFFHDPEGIPYATIQVDEHFETWPIRSKGFRHWVRRRFWRECQRALSSQPLQDALGVFESKGLFDGKEEKVFIRVAEHEESIYLDLGREDWKAVKIAPDGWKIVDAPPVKFRQSNGMSELPEPIRGGDIEELRQFMNLEDQDSFSLVAVFLVACLRPCGPFPILIVGGEQGSAKSTLCRVFHSLVDPNSAPLRSAPRDAQNLMIAAKNGWILTFDNFSRIPLWLSDALCRLATGGGFGTRELYTDDEEVLFNAMRPVLVNGIEELATRSDLLDRSITLTLPSIPDSKRKTETQLWREFEKARPRILGALLDALSVALREAPHVQLDSMPRMADFAAFGVAVEKGLGLAPGSFLRAYTGNRESANDFAIEASAVGPYIIRLMEEKGSWEGIAKELLEELESLEHVDERTWKRRDWPKTPKAMAGALRRIAANLRQLGIDITFCSKREGKARRRLIRIEKHKTQQVTPSATTAMQEKSEQEVRRKADDVTHADGQIQMFSQDLPPEWREKYEEKAGKLEFQGGLSQEQAEAEALAETIAQMKNEE